jgi:hypothetical protein
MERLAYTALEEAITHLDAVVRHARHSPGAIVVGGPVRDGGVQVDG